MTKNGTSNNSGEQPEESLRHTFSKAERIYRKKTFEVLFDGGASFYLGKLWVIYTDKLPEEWVLAPSMVAFVVTKRNFKRANKRNMLKRRMKEAYRLHKHLLVEQLVEQNRNLTFLVKYNTREILSYAEIEENMVRVLKKLKKAL